MDCLFIFHFGHKYRTNLLIYLPSSHKDHFARTARTAPEDATRIPIIAVEAIIPSVLIKTSFCLLSDIYANIQPYSDYILFFFLLCIHFIPVFSKSKACLFYHHDKYFLLLIVF